MGQNQVMLTNWNKYTVTVNSNKGPLTLHWNEVEALAFYSALQTGLYGGVSKDLTKQVFFEHFPKWLQTQWDHHYNLAGDLPAGATVIDVGSGIGTIDLLQSLHTLDAKFILVDDQVQQFQKEIYYSEKYPYYNSWAPTVDAINSTGIDATRFKMQGALGRWAEADLIVSYFSWCFHYPKKTYWLPLLHSLKVGGKLILDVRLIEGRDIIGEISEELKCDPYKDPIPNLIPEWIDNYPSPDPDIMGYRCMWTRH